VSQKLSEQKLDQNPHWVNGDQGHKAKILWEMTQSEGWKLLVNRDKKSGGFVGIETDRSLVRVCSPDTNAPDFFRGKLDALRGTQRWVDREIESGINRE